MDLDKLRELGGFVPPAPVKREVTWQPLDAEGRPCGEPVTFTAHIKRLSAGTWEKLRQAASPDRSHAASLISQLVLLGDEGNENFPYVMAEQLDLTLLEKLVDAIDSVNPIRKGTVDAAKN